VNVIVSGDDPRASILALEAILGMRADATGCVIQADGTPGARDASWWFDDEGLAGMARELFDDAQDEAGEKSPILVVTGPEEIG